MLEGGGFVSLCLYVAFKTALCNLTLVCVCECTDVQRSLVLLELLILAWFALECLTFVNYNQ